MSSMTVLMAAVARAAQAETFPPPCDLVPVKKPVKTETWREYYDRSLQLKEKTK